MFKIMQGDAYNIPIIIKVDDTPITSSDVSDVEICIGKLIKTYADNEITYNDGKWYFPLSQQETFAMKCMHLDAQVRVKFNNNVVKGVYIPDFISVHSISKGVL